jgi:hypothetical protein
MAWLDIVSEVAKIETAVVACEAAVPAVDALTKEVATVDRIALADHAVLDRQICALVGRLNELRALCDEQRELTKSEADHAELVRVQAEKDCVTTQERDRDGNVVCIAHESKALGKVVSRAWSYTLAGGALTATGGAIEIKDIA